MVRKLVEMSFLPHDLPHIRTATRNSQKKQVLKILPFTRIDQNISHRSLLDVNRLHLSLARTAFSTVRERDRQTVQQQTTHPYILR